MVAITGLLCHHLACSHISDLWGVVMLKRHIAVILLVLFVVNAVSMALGQLLSWYIFG